MRSHHLPTRWECSTIYKVNTTSASGNSALPGTGAPHILRVEDLSMSKREAQVTVRPVAQLAAGTQLNAKVGRHVVENVGLLETAAVVTAYVREIRSYRLRRARLDAGAPERVGEDPLREAPTLVAQAPSELRRVGRRPVDAVPRRSLAALALGLEVGTHAQARAVV